MKADLETGVAPDEAVQVLLNGSLESATASGVARFVKKYLAVRNLPYVVRSLRRGEGNYIIVQKKRSF